jgi:RimJ/RimL family protein N-acetyltransferase
MTVRERRTNPARAAQELAMSVVVILEAPRLRLRQLDEGDAAFLRQLNDDPRVHRYTGDGPLPDDDAALDILRSRIFPQYTKHRVGRWAVERDDDRGGYVAIGWCGLRFDEDDGTFDLAYRFFEDRWGNGYATEAVSATLAWARTRFPDTPIVARVDVSNHASRRVLEKVGMTYLGTEQDADGLVAVFRKTTTADGECAV